MSDWWPYLIEKIGETEFKDKEGKIHKIPRYIARGYCNVLDEDAEAMTDIEGTRSSVIRPIDRSRFHFWVRG